MTYIHPASLYEKKCKYDLYVDEVDLIQANPQ